MLSFSEALSADGPGTRFKMLSVEIHSNSHADTGADLGGGCRGCAPSPKMKPSSYSLLKFVYLVAHRSVTSFLRGSPPSKKNPGSAPETSIHSWISSYIIHKARKIFCEVRAGTNTPEICISLKAAHSPATSTLQHPTGHRQSHDAEVLYEKAALDLAPGSI